MTSDEVRLARVNDPNGSCLVELLSVPVLDPNMHNPNSVFATRLLRVCLTSFAAFGRARIKGCVKREATYLCAEI